jgi:hypothetical protein
MIRQHIVSGLMVFCTLLAAFWLVMSWSSRRSYDSFTLTPEKMATFHPALEGWDVRALPITRDDLIDANIAAYSLVRDSSSPVINNRQPIPNNRFLVRLVHGYNMPMCMKMKYYTVEKILDYKVRPVADPKLRSAFRNAKTINDGTGEKREENSIEQKNAKDAKGEELGSAGGGEEHSSLRSSRTSVQNPILFTSVPAGYPLPIQLWRLTSSVGTVSIWATTMIQSDDFSPTEDDICSMAFPRIDIPDDPNWVPRGLAWDDLRHPKAAFMRWFRSRWDGARWDVLTFLRLRRPVRTSEELLSYVTLIEVVAENNTNAIDIRELLEAHGTMLKELQGWRNSGESVAK